MIASTIIVLLSLPIYSALFHRFDVIGLAIASDVGILMHTVVLAWLLNRNKLVVLGEMPWMELLKAFASAMFAGCAGFAVARSMPFMGTRGRDIVRLLAITGAWVVATVLGLWVTRSKLPRELRRKRAPATPNVTVPDPMVERTTGGLEP
jgi:putative peptidoglycan lipid II flippase